MLEFTCSTCGKQVQADDSFAAKRVQCPVCETTAAIAAPEHAVQAKIAQPASGGAFAEELPPLHDGPMPLTRDEVPGVFGRWLPYIIGGISAVVAIALIIPAMQKTREAAARTQSINNLKQIVLSMHGFCDTDRRLPYNGTKPAVAADNITGSWAFMILPYFGNFENGVFNDVHIDRGLATFICPGRGRPDRCTGAGGPGPWTDYFINPFLNDPNGIANAPDVKQTLANIAAGDGTSNTIFVGHGQIRPGDYGSIDAIPGFTTTIFNGGNPAMCRGNTKVVNARDSAESMPGNWGGPFSQGSLMGMGDGTVRMFPYTMTGGTIVNGICNGEPGMFGLYLTPSGGEMMSPPDT